MSRKVYPEYKPSGIEWLGEIPEHWLTLECKFGYSIQLGKMLQNEPLIHNDEQVPYLKALHVQWENVDISDLPEMWASPEDIRKYSVKDGDLLVCEGGEVGRAGVLRNPPAKCIIQNALHRVRPKKGSNNRFLMYLLEVASYRGWFDILCNKATIAHFTGEKFGWLSIALPPPYEQRAIVAFLDWETARIDALIEKKQRQIELLQEKRAAVISHVVTKGLDPNVRMKPSGIEWLGEIPEHWDTSECKFAFSIQLGKMLQNEPQTINDEQVPYLKALHVRWGSIDISDLPEMWASLGDIRKYSVRDGDLLVCEGGEVGRAGILRNPPAKCIIQNALHRVRPRGENSNRFLMYLLEVASYRGWFDILCNKATIAHFTGEKFGSLSITLPPPHEQRAIVAFLDRETARIDALIEKIRRSIDLLREYRTALITAAVTGKIDVREEVV